MSNRISIAALLAVVLSASVAEAGYYLDTPHNGSNGIDCTTCHSLPVFLIPNYNPNYHGGPTDPIGKDWVTRVSLNPEDTLVNNVCLECHAEGSGNSLKGPSKKLHSSSTTGSATIWSTNCTQCHDQHFQGQLDWITTTSYGANPIYLATGEFQTSSTGRTLTWNSAGNYTTIGINSTITARDLTWANVYNWKAKGGRIDNNRAQDGSRGLILVPSLDFHDQTYEIVDVYTNASGLLVIKVKGNMDASEAFDTGIFGVIYGQLIRSSVMPNGGKTTADLRDVKFFQPELIGGTLGGPADLTSGAAKPMGLCQVCHTSTSVWRSDGSSENHNNISGTKCVDCHNAPAGFPPPASIEHVIFIGDRLGNGCVTCHAGIVADPTSHAGSCNTCHTSTPPTINTASLANEGGGLTVYSALDNGAYDFNATYPFRLIDAEGDGIGSPSFLKIDCCECHKAKPAALANGSHGPHMTDFGKDAICIDCHNGASVLVNIHGNGTVATCTMCHSALPATRNNEIIGSSVNGVDGDATLANGTAVANNWDNVTCLTCHPAATYPAGTIHHNTTNAVNGNCVACHVQGGSHGGDHSPRVSASATNCNTSCHPFAPVVGTTTGIPVSPVTDKVHNACTTCHQVVGSTVIKNATTAKAPLRPVNGGNCNACHGAYFVNHTRADHTARVNNHVDCSTCHTDALVKGTPTTCPVDGVPGTKIHDACTTCHDATTGAANATTSKAPLRPAGGGDCKACHSAVYFEGHLHPGHIASVKVNTLTTPPTSTCVAAGCHEATLAPFVGGGQVHLSCSSCHTVSTGGLKGSATGHATGGECVTCHFTYFDGHLNHNGTGATHAVLMRATDLAGGIACNNCHRRGGNGSANPLFSNTWAGTDGIFALHTGGCTMCHDSTRTSNVKSGYASLQAVIQDDAISIGCLDCHADKTVHGGHNAGDFAWTVATQTSCGAINCHNYALNSDVIKQIHGNGSVGTCGICHVAQNGSGSRRVGSDADATLAGTDATAECTICHAVKPTIGGMHHDTDSAANNNCTTTCHQTVDHTAYIGDSNSCNAKFCHANPNVDGYNDSAVGNQPVATLVDPSNPMKHDSCRTCHTFAAVTLAGTLRAPTGKKGVTGASLPVTGGPCTGCHVQATALFHHQNVNTANGACTQCHNDPRNDAYDDTLTPSYNMVPVTTKPTNQMVCDECHLTPLANTNGWNGNMTISAWNEGGTHSTTNYSTAFTRTVAHTASGTGHVIPNTSGTIDNWGICFSCHDGASSGLAASQISPLHASPTTTMAACTGTFAPGNPFGGTSAIARWYFLGNSWRPTATGSANCSANLPTFTASATVASGIRGTIASFTVPDPWATTAINRVVPVWVNPSAPPAKTTAPIAIDIKVTSAVWNGSTLTVNAITTGTCTNLALLNGKGNVNFDSSCVATVGNYAYPADGTTVDVVDYTTDSTGVIGYRIADDSIPVSAGAVNDTFSVAAYGVTNLLVRANDTGSGITITSVTQPTQGAVVISGGTSVNYTGNGTIGSTSFTYTITASDSSTSTANVNLALLADTTPPTVGTVTVVPTGGANYTGAAPIITATLVDAQSPVTSCTYTTDGSTWFAGVVSGTASPWTCTGLPTGLAGVLNINVRGASSGGIGTGIAVTRTVDVNPPSSGTLTVIPGSEQIDLTWTASTDAEVGMRATNTYDVRFLIGDTAPTCATGISIYSGSLVGASHAGLVSNTQYSYRVCAYDAAGNVSTGAIGSGTALFGHEPDNFAWTPETQVSCGAANCHNYVGNTDVRRDVHGNQCRLCHVYPGGGGNRKGGSDGDATLAGTDPTTICTVCHSVRPSIGGMHHDTENVSNNRCATTCHQNVDHTAYIVDSNSCNAKFCHANPNYDMTNDSAAGTQSAATLIDPTNPMKHDSCRTCHTFAAVTLAGTLRAPTGKKGVTGASLPVTGGLCTDCHVQATALFHHQNVNTANGACTQCHNDPRNDAYDDTLTPSYNMVPVTTKPTNQMVCDECHLTPLANTNGWNGNMTISAWNEGGTHSTTNYSTAFTRTVAHTASGTGHVIPNTSGTIDNWGICFSCHDGAGSGLAVSQISPLHASPTTTMAACTGTFAPGNPFGGTSAIARWYFLGNSWRPTATGSANCSANLPTFTASATVASGIRGTIAPFTVPDPWATTAANKVIPVWVSPPSPAAKTTAPNAVDIKIVSAIWDGTSLTVNATTTGTCTNLTLVNGSATPNVPFNSGCVATIASYTYPANGTTVDVVDNTADSISVLAYRITSTALIPAGAVADTAIAAVNGVTNLLPMANDTGSDIVITGVTQPSLGSVAISGGGTSIDFTGTGMAGSTSFGYTITASDLSTSTATVNLTVANTVAALDAWTEVYSGVPAASPVAAGSFAVSAGANRMLLVAVVMEYGSAANPTISATYGGTALTQIAISANSQREAVWIGRLNDTGIGSGTKALSLTYSGSIGTVSATHVKWTSFTGVNQTTPVAGSTARSTAAVTVASNAAVNYVLYGMTVAVAGNGGTPATVAVTASPALISGTINTSNAQSSKSFVSARHTGAGTYASGGISFTWSGTTSAWSAMAVASLQP